MQVSAETGEGLEELREALEGRFLSSLRPMELLVPYDEGGSLSELHELAGELEREDTADGVRVRARVPAGRRGALRALLGQRQHRSEAPLLAPERERARRPSRAHDDDAGLDLHADEAATLGPGERASVGTGVALADPRRAGRAWSCRARGSRRGTGSPS